MDHIDIQLLGRFSFRRNGSVLPGTSAYRVRELLGYLVLHGSRPHHREILADALWGQHRADQARKYLRQTLWQLQSALGSEALVDEPQMLVIDSEWIQLSTEVQISVDAVQLERAFCSVRDISGYDLTSPQTKVVEDAVALYEGDLLDGWYQDWCLIQRERLRTMYLILLEKLAVQSEVSREYERGIAFGHQLLAHDYAREQAHRQLMRLYALLGDRTAALRQYERCVAALADELDILPAQRTVMLYNQIRADQFPDVSQERLPASASSPMSSVRSSLPADMAEHVRQTYALLGEALRQVRSDLDAAERLLAVEEEATSRLAGETSQLTQQRQAKRRR